jgi:hypothetical protein
MITCKLELLPKEQDRALRVWLSSDEYHTLTRVIEAKVKHHECEALAAALESSDHNLKSEAAAASMARAQLYHHCLDVLREIRQVPVTQPFEIAKLQ